MTYVLCDGPLLLRDVHKFSLRLVGNVVSHYTLRPESFKKTDRAFDVSGLALVSQKRPCIHPCGLLCSTNHEHLLPFAGPSPCLKLRS
jgi:hypothetical protein